MDADLLAQMEVDAEFPRHGKKKSGRPRKAYTTKGGRKKRAFMNSAVFVGQDGHKVPVVRLLLTLPVPAAAKLDRLGGLLGTSASGAVCCMIDDHPDPATIIPPPGVAPAQEDAAEGVWRPLWLPTVLGGKLLRYLSRTGETLNQYVARMVDVMPDPDLLTQPHSAFRGWVAPGEASSE